VPLLFLISLDVLVGMWLERYVIVITSLHRDFLPSSWGNYEPTRWDWATYVGTLGLFFFLMFLFIRFLPVISISEMQMLLPEARPAGGHDQAHTETAHPETAHPEPSPASHQPALASDGSGSAPSTPATPEGEHHGH